MGDKIVMPGPARFWICEDVRRRGYGLNGEELMDRVK